MRTRLACLRRSGRDALAPANMRFGTRPRLSSPMGRRRCNIAPWLLATICATAHPTPGQEGPCLLA